MKFSIIVPVYGVEKYVERCIKSVLNQSYSNFELIIVDDESPDDSIKIIKENCIDNRIKIVSKNNGGLSSARNYGLKYVTGDYIWFVDSDDYISDLYALEKLVTTINIQHKPDIVVFNNTVLFEEGSSKGWLNINAPINTKSFTGQDYIATFSNMPINAWTQVYNKIFFFNNKFLFTEKMYFEDIYLNLDIYLKAQSVVGIKAFLVNYIKREDSIMTRKFNVTHFTSEIKVLQKFDYYLKNNLLDKKYLSNRIQYEYIFLKKIYVSCKKEVLELGINIDSGIIVPSIYKDSIFIKLEKKIFRYFPNFVLKYNILFEKLK